MPLIQRNTPPAPDRNSYEQEITRLNRLKRKSLLARFLLRLSKEEGGQAKVEDFAARNWNWHERDNKLILTFEEEELLRDELVNTLTRRKFIQSSAIKLGLASIGAGGLIEYSIRRDDAGHASAQRVTAGQAALVGGIVASGAGALAMIMDYDERNLDCLKKEAHQPSIADEEQEIKLQQSIRSKLHIRVKEDLNKQPTLNEALHAIAHSQATGRGR